MSRKNIDALGINYTVSRENKTANHVLILSVQSRSLVFASDLCLDRLGSHAIKNWTAAFGGHEDSRISHLVILWPDLVAVL